MWYLPKKKTCCEPSGKSTAILLGKIYHNSLTWIVQGHFTGDDFPIHSASSMGGHGGSVATRRDGSTGWLGLRLAEGLTILRRQLRHEEDRIYLAMPWDSSGFLHSGDVEISMEHIYRENSIAIIVMEHHHFSHGKTRNISMAMFNSYFEIARG